VNLLIKFSTSRKGLNAACFAMKLVLERYLGFCHEGFGFWTSLKYLVWDEESPPFVSTSYPQSNINKGIVSYAIITKGFLILECMLTSI